MTKKVEATLGYGAYVNMSQLSEILGRLSASPDRGKITVCIWGPPGTGKSELVKQVAQKQGMECIRYDLPTIDYIQLTGVPELRHEADGTTRGIRHPIIRVPATGDGIFCLDDFTHAPQAVQNVALDFAQEHRLNDAVLGQNWMLVLCANESGGVYPMQPPIANRLLHFYVKCDIESWRDWAVKAQIRPEVVAFLETHPDFLYQPPQAGEKSFPTPRSWEKASAALDIMFSHMETRTEEKALVEETQGEGPLSTLKEVIRPVKTSRKVRDTLVGLGPVETRVVIPLVTACVGATGAQSFVTYLRTFHLINIRDFDGDNPPTQKTLQETLSGSDSKANYQAVCFALMGHARGYWAANATWSTKSKSSEANRERARFYRFFVNVLKVLPKNMQAIFTRDIAHLDRERHSDISKMLQVPEFDLLTAQGLSAAKGKYLGRVVKLDEDTWEVGTKLTSTNLDDMVQASKKCGRHTLIISASPDLINIDLQKIFEDYARVATLSD